MTSNLGLYRHCVNGMLSCQTGAPKNVALFGAAVENKRVLQQILDKLLKLGGITAAQLKRK